ncbi:hypothetical protein TorRG33x02_259270 [Trema orientale]|uniref:Endonuclease/exonuclease/phosphatase n=1 Tax=Trema orientale TaxID=63057 RepID=A0A2P5D873_TREOI|nr:hypothetical protein TorRG33x02_259270 [Trema orientale]
MRRLRHMHPYLLRWSLYVEHSMATSAGVRTLPIIKESDHAPLILDTHLEREKVSTPFRFLDAWSRDHSCRQLIEEAWRISVSEFRSSRLVLKMDNTKKALKKWNRECFGFCQDKLRILSNLLVEVQNRRPTQANLDLEAAVQREISEVEERQELIRKQKSRELWLSQGDRNTRFFHASTVFRRKRNHV